MNCVVSHLKVKIWVWELIALNDHCFLFGRNWKGGRGLWLQSCCECLRLMILQQDGECVCYRKITVRCQKEKQTRKWKKFVEKDKQSCVWALCADIMSWPWSAWWTGCPPRLASRPTHTWWRGRAGCGRWRTPSLWFSAPRCFAGWWSTERASTPATPSTAAGSWKQTAANEEVANPTGA